MAWRWPGDRPLSEPVMVRLLTHICVTRPQWVNSIQNRGYIYMYIYIHTYIHTCIHTKSTVLYHMGQVTKLQLSCYLVLLLVDSKTRLTRQPQFRDLTHMITHYWLKSNNALMKKWPKWCWLLYAWAGMFLDEICKFQIDYKKWLQKIHSLNSTLGKILLMQNYRLYP